MSDNREREIPVNTDDLEYAIEDQVVDTAPEMDAISEEGRARIRKELAAARAQRQPGRGLLMVYTGNGKGKTTAALGVLFRAWGQGMRGVMLQFLKSQTGNWGEIKAAQRVGIEIVPLGDGFTWDSKNLEHDKALALECWRLCREKVESGEYDLVIMDEITYAINYGWLNLKEVLTVLQQRNKRIHIVITGRDAPLDLISAADLVTEMREIKHPFKEGLMAQRGIDF